MSVFKSRAVAASTLGRIFPLTSDLAWHSISKKNGLESGLGQWLLHVYMLHYRAHIPLPTRHTC